MKKTLLMLMAIMVMASSFASYNLTEPPKNAASIFISIGKTGAQISLMDLSQIRVSEFEMLSGKKMRFTDKVGFKIAQRELRNSINDDGTLNSKRLNKLADKMAAGTGDFNIGGFALGFFLLIIGVLIAYVISDDNKAARTKWAWIGLAAALVLYLLFAVL
ncbi:MAG: hypothetical protein WKF70_12175 [Chitinophagaceae bacterium]